MRAIAIFSFLLLCMGQTLFSQTRKSDNLQSVRQPLFTEIETGLRKIMEEHRNEPNTTTTWAQIRNEVDRFLYGYFRNGKLLGSKPQEAYFIQIGMQTMTQADISANRKVLIAGISVQKPAEFVSITVETSSKSVSRKSVF